MPGSHDHSACRKRVIFIGIRLALIGTLVLLGSLFAIPEVMAASPSDDADPETISTGTKDKCIEVLRI